MTEGALALEIFGIIFLLSSFARTAQKILAENANIGF
jgi:hypothetical protein